jgi:IclR family transcriptional regulator, acetate operon repressor
VSRVQSIERAFSVLGALADGPVGVSDVAERVALPKSTTARLLASLVREGVVEQVPGGTRYRLGGRIAALAAGISSTAGLVAVARPHLVELASTVGEAAGLSVRDGTLVHYIDQVDTTHQVQVRDWTGTRVPMHAVSSGQVFLAHAPPGLVERVLAEPLEPFTARTLTTKPALRRRLRQVLLDGHAWVHEEFAEGLNSVAAPIVEPTGEVIAAVHVHGPAYRFPVARAEEHIAAQVRRTAGRVSDRLRGGAGPIAPEV